MNKMLREVLERKGNKWEEGVEEHCKRTHKDRYTPGWMRKMLCSVEPVLCVILRMRQQGVPSSGGGGPQTKLRRFGRTIVMMSTCQKKKQVVITPIPPQRLRYLFGVGSFNKNKLSSSTELCGCVLRVGSQATETAHSRHKT